MKQLKVLGNENLVGEETEIELSQVFTEDELEKRISKIPEKDLEKAEEEYSYLESNEKPRYSKNLTDEEAKLVEKIITRTAYSHFICNPLYKQQKELSDIRMEIVVKLLNQATLKDEDGNVMRDENGQVMLRENGIARNMAEIRMWIKNAARDIYRYTKRRTDREDRYFDMDQKDSDNYVVSGENRLYQESEVGREAMMGNSTETNLEFEQLFDSLLDENNYDELREVLNIKPKRMEEIKKFIVTKAYHAGINDMKVINEYKKYELELDEEKKELIAECEASKSDGGITSDVLLKAYFNIKTGINAGSAGRITRGIPVIIEEMLKSKFPGYLN